MPWPRAAPSLRSPVIVTSRAGTYSVRATSETSCATCRSTRRAPCCASPPKAKTSSPIKRSSASRSGAIRKPYCASGSPSSAFLQTWPHNKAVRVAGRGTGRQRPGTATGVFFLTLEDEFGSINVVVWNDLTSRQRNEVLSGRLLGVSGVVERAEGVIHVIAGRLEDHTVLLGRLATSSRDFH